MVDVPICRGGYMAGEDRCEDGCMVKGWRTTGSFSVSSLTANGVQIALCDRCIAVTPRSRRRSRGSSSQIVDRRRSSFVVLIEM
jgi:hypothetical protein